MPGALKEPPSPFGQPTTLFVGCRERMCDDSRQQQQQLCCSCISSAQVIGPKESSPTLSKEEANKSKELLSMLVSEVKVSGIENVDSELTHRL